MITLTVKIQRRADYAALLDPAEARLEYSLGLWLWEETATEALFAGAVYVSGKTLERLLSARPLIEEIATTAEARLHLDGDYPDVPPHPSLGKLVKVLRMAKATLLGG